MKQLPEGFTQFTHEGVLLAYNPLTGEGVKWCTPNGRGTAFRWNPITPCTTRDKRTQVWINGSMQQWHRIVAQHFIHESKPIPDELVVDHRKHVDGTTAQDILTNLRIVTKPENGQNRKNGSSQFAGVCWGKAAGKWLARAVNPLTGKRQTLGYFTDEYKAAEAYIDFYKKHGLPCAPASERLAA